MLEAKNAILLAVVAVIYFTALASLFRYRRQLGIGSFFCVLGVMHFIETYFASVFYVPLPFGVTASPGSAVLFTGKLVMLLLVYIREDAAVVRQPIYGLFIGNLLTVSIAFIMRQHDLVPLAPGRTADLAFIDEMGALMVWGTLLLLIDSILIILVYEKTRSWFGMRLLPRIAFSAAAIMTFDQLGFYLGLKMLIGADFTVMIGGWVAKMAAVAIYAAMATLYLRRFEAATDDTARRISDVFSVLTYRERYEDLLASSKRDALTGVLDRRELETQGRMMVISAVLGGRPVSLLVVDVDHFKEFNDRFGHAFGDIALKRIADAIAACVRPGDHVFRFGGEEFVVICDGVGSGAARNLGERIRREIASFADSGPSNTVSVGVASCAEDASNYDDMFAIADRRLYEAKAAGRNCVIGRPVTADGKSIRLAYTG